MSAQNSTDTTKLPSSSSPQFSNNDSPSQLKPPNKSQLPTPAPPLNIPVTTIPPSETKSTKYRARNSNTSHVEQPVDDVSHLRTPPSTSHLRHVSMSPVSPQRSISQRGKNVPRSEAVPGSLDHPRLSYDGDSDAEWSPEEDDYEGVPTRSRGLSAAQLSLIQQHHADQLQIEAQKRELELKLATIQTHGSARGKKVATSLLTGDLSLGKNGKIAKKNPIPSVLGVGGVEGFAVAKKDGILGKTLPKATSPGLTLGTSVPALENSAIVPGLGLAGLGLATGLLPSLTAASRQPTPQELALAQLQLQALQMNLASTALGLSATSDTSGLNAANQLGLNFTGSQTNQSPNGNGNSVSDTVAQTQTQSNQQADIANQLAMLQILNQLQTNQMQHQTHRGADSSAPAKGSTGGTGMNLGVGLGLVPSPGAALRMPVLGAGTLDHNIGGEEDLGSNTQQQQQLQQSSHQSHSGSRVDPLYNPNKTTNVYINNLPLSFTETQLYQLCAAFGPIASVRMMLRESGTCYGFVLFEAIEAAESCILWLRQFSDVHPSFARSPKMLPRPNDSTESRPSHPNVASQILQSPIHFHENAETLVALAASNQLNPHARLTINPRDNSTNITGHNTQSHATQSLVTPVRSLSNATRTPSSGPRPPGSGSNDVRVLQGRVPNGGTGLGVGSPAQFAQLAKLGLASPVTPLTHGGIGANANNAEKPDFDAQGKPRLKTHLIVDGLPGNIDLPTVEALFSPHAVLSARFFRKPSNDEHGGSRVVAFVRLGSEQAAEESIDKLNGRSVPGWDSSKMKVVYADDETQNEQTASEKRIRELIARQEAHPESPLQQKSINTNDFRYTNASLPKPSFSSLPATSSHTQDVRRDTYQQQFGGSARRGYVINIPGSNETRYADFQDSPASQASPPPLPPIRPGYKVPNNTPARVVDPTQHGASHYVVQLPSSYLSQCQPPHEQAQHQQVAPAVLQAPIHVPPPSIFKAAPPSRPLEIRRPPSSEKSSEVIPTTPANPQALTSGINEDVEMSPVSSAGTATPATMGGPFTPYTDPSEFPALVEDKEQQNEKSRRAEENGRGARGENAVHFNEDF